MAEILASLDDINANLPSEEIAGGGAVVVATTENTALLQISVARVVRGYLSRILPSATLLAWVDPDTTPEIIREVAGKFIAAQLFFNKAARTSLEIEDRNFAQLLYDEAMKILNNIVSGFIEIPGIIIDIDELTVLDFHPIDDTDRAFSMGMDL